MVKLLSFATVLACVAAVATASTITDNADTRNLRSAVAEEAAAHRHVHVTAMEARGKNLNALHHHVANAEMEAANADRRHHRGVMEAANADRRHRASMEAANADRRHRASMEAANADRRHHRPVMEAANADRGHHRPVMEAANADRGHHRPVMEAKANNKAASAMGAANTAGLWQRAKSTAQSWMDKVRGSTMEAKPNGGFGSLAQLMKRSKVAMEGKGVAENDAGMMNFRKGSKKMMHGRKG